MLAWKGVHIFYHTLLLRRALTLSLTPPISFIAERQKGGSRVAERKALSCFCFALLCFSAAAFTLPASDKAHTPSNKRAEHDIVVKQRSIVAVTWCAEERGKSPSSSRGEQTSCSKQARHNTIHGPERALRHGIALETYYQQEWSTLSEVHESNGTWQQSRAASER